MTFQSFYHTPPGFDDLLMRSDGEVLTELRFVKAYDAEHTQRDLPIFQKVSRWLDCYFAGNEPDFTPEYKLEGATPFRQEVLEWVRRIPFGETMTYGEIAARIAQRHATGTMSAQAVGGAVGWNPICIIIPCHRVIGAHNKLTGYSGGMENKIALLKNEELRIKTIVHSK